MEQTESISRVLLVTGVSGAGKSSALKTLEDLGYEAIDNVPLSLLSRLIPPSNQPQSLVIGIDIRSRHYSTDQFLKVLKLLQDNDNIEVSLIFLECDDEILVRRFEETRRRHPLAIERPIMDGITQERELMMPVRDRSTLVVDTTDLSVGDMKGLLEGHFAVEKTPGPGIFVTSFGFKRGLPRNADLVFDVRFLRNPHYNINLRPLTGLDDEVGSYISEDQSFDPFIDKITELLELLLDRYAAEGKSYLTIAIGCTGGKHRSVFTAKKLTEWFHSKDIPALLSHRDINKSSLYPQV